MFKLIVAISLSLSICLAALAETTPEKLPGNIAILIAKRHYEHPVRLLHPYLDVWHMKGPLAEKAALKVLQKRFANINLCSDSKNADVVLLLEPQMFYNAQLRVFHAEYLVKVYAPSSESPNTENAITKIKKQAQQVGEISIKPDYYMEKAYVKAMEKIVKTLETDKAFLAALNGKKTNTAEESCNAINDLPISNIYY
jgi:hypothetical protein